MIDRFSDSQANGNAGVTKIDQAMRHHGAVPERFGEREHCLDRLIIEGVTGYAIVAINIEGDIVLWNSGAERLFGHRNDQVIGKNFSLMYAHEAVALGTPTAEVLTAASEGRASVEAWYVRRDGKRFYGTGQMMQLRDQADETPSGFVKVLRDITAPNEARAAISRKAAQDDLTRLPNRSYFSECLQRSIAHTQRHPTKLFGVLFIDLDRFKVINDSLGHMFADRVLVRTARVLEQCVRPEDIVARFGGDEFTVLISEIQGTADAIVIADRIQAALQLPFHVDGLDVVTSASVGIAIGSAAYKTSEKILRDADIAMYEAKSLGRSRYVMFDSTMHDRAVALLKLQTDLRWAIIRQELYVEYQPIVSLHDGRVVGFEALVRWMHPERGRLAPVAFIGEAENLGLIIQIDRWVLHEACRQLRDWQVEHDDFTLTVSVNLSSKQFADESLLPSVRDALQENHLPGQSLKLEITETVLMQNEAATAIAITQLGELGVELYIDDFGTGYSSLSYLTRFPLKLLKVDRSFVSRIESNPRSAVIVRTVVQLAHNLNLGALAEGIETDGQLSTLHDLGCEFGQGYWFSPPVSAKIAHTFIGRSLPLPADELIR